MSDKEKKEEAKRSVDPACDEVFGVCDEISVGFSWDRLAKQQPQCGFGQRGQCCRICAMGPCRVMPDKEKYKYGVCGVDVDTVAARNFARMVAAGVASHSDHGRGIAETFLATAEGKADGYWIKDEQKLLQVALDFGIEVGDRDIKDIAIDVGRKAVAMFGEQHGPIPFLKRAPLKRQEIWKKYSMEPRGVDREVVEMMHRTHMGVDQDPVNLMQQASRCALADGWGGSMLATELQDILFGTPQPILGEANLGVLKEDEVNIVIHGHEPTLSEAVMVAVQDPELIEKAKKVGAKGINLGGLCCSANEILMRHGVPNVGNFLQQELALATGAVDLMAVDVQCLMDALPRIAQQYHTKFITTNYRAKMSGAEHVQFDEHRAPEIARRIVEMAIEAYTKRGKTNIPKQKNALVAGFSHETIDYLLGGVFRASYKPLNDNIINGRIRGIAGVVGCNNPKTVHDSAHIALVKELIANDVIVLQTGCSALASAKAGLMVPEAAQKYAGKGLAEVCEAVGIPPVLHMGACVDNSRILMAATAVVKEGGLGDDISDLPAAGAAPEWMSEKAIAIGQYFVASGVYTVFGTVWPALGAPGFKDLLFNKYEQMVGGKWDFAEKPGEIAAKMIDHINKKRAALGLDKARERILYDMEMRRKLDAV